MEKKYWIGQFDCSCAPQQASTWEGELGGLGGLGIMGLTNTSDLGLVTELDSVRNNE